MHTYMNGTSMVVFLLVASGWQTPKREATFSFERMDSQEVVCWQWYMNASAVEGFEFLLILKSLHLFQVISGMQEEYHQTLSKKSLLKKQNTGLPY